MIDKYNDTSGVAYYRPSRNWDREDKVVERYNYRRQEAYYYSPYLINYTA